MRPIVFVIIGEMLTIIIRALCAHTLKEWIEVILLLALGMILMYAALRPNDSVVKKVLEWF